MISTTVFNNPGELAQAVAQRTIEDLQDAIYTHGSAVWCLSGGSTPMAAYEIIARESLRDLDWSKVYIIIGDERSVPLDSHDSSWKQADTILLQYLPRAHRIRPKSDLTPEDAAADYESRLNKLPTKKGILRIDVLWLGIGEDGHTLSLFPNHVSLDETTRTVIAIHNAPKPPADRISLSLAALAGASTCYVLAAGHGKRSITRRALEGDDALPITRVTHKIDASGGLVSWLIDAAASYS